MTGLWLEDGELRLADDLAEPVPDGEAVVRVAMAGICNTDLELVHGYYPFAGVLGHEFVGVVESAPPPHEELVGRRVVGEINAVCGACDVCRAGRRTHCPERTVLGIVGRDGAFAERLVLPAENLHVVPDDVVDDDAVFVEPLAAALEIQRQIPISRADRILVVGDGKLGQLIARTLAIVCDEVTVAGRHASKLDLLAARGIATLLVAREDSDARVDGEDPDMRVDGEDPDVRVAGDDTNLTDSWDIVVECTGKPGGFDFARRAVRPLGTLVMKSTYADRLTLDASSLVVDEVTLVGSRCGPFAPALELLASGELGVTELIDARYALTDGLAAFERAGQRGAMKVLLQISPSAPLP